MPENKLSQEELDSLLSTPNKQQRGLMEVPDVDYSTSKWNQVAPINYNDYADYIDQSRFDPFDRSGMDKLRAENQGFGEQLMLKAANAFPNIGLQLAGSAGRYAALVSEWGDERDYTNWLTEWSERNKDIFGKTYREDPNKVIDMGDSAFWLDTFAGIFESAQAFGAEAILTGGAIQGVASKIGQAATAISSALKAKKAGQVANAIVESVDLAKNAGSMTSKAYKWLGKGAREIPKVANSALLAYSETAMEAPQTYNRVFKEATDRGIDEIEADKLARAATVSSVTANVLMQTGLNLGILSSLYASPKGAREFLKSGVMKESKLTGGVKKGIDDIRNSGTFKKWIKGDATVGSYVSEGIQESVEELMQVGTANRASRAAGKSDGDVSFIDQLLEMKESFGDIATEEGILSGFSGALGGVMHKAVIDNNPFKRKFTYDEKGEIKMTTDKYGNQTPELKRQRNQKFEERRKEALFNKYANSALQDIDKMDNLIKDIEKATVENKPRSEVDALKRELFDIKLYNSVQSGIGEHLGQDLKDIANLDNEKDLGSEMLEQAQELETQKNERVAQLGDNTTEQDKQELAQLDANIAELKAKGAANMGVTRAMKAGFSSGKNDNEYKERAEQSLADLEEASNVYEAFEENHSDGDNGVYGVPRALFRTWLTDKTAKRDLEASTKDYQQQEERIKQKLIKEGVSDKIIEKTLDFQRLATRKEIYKAYKNEFSETERTAMEEEIKNLQDKINEEDRREETLYTTKDKIGEAYMTRSGAIYDDMTVLQKEMGDLQSEIQAIQKDDTLEPEAKFKQIAEKRNAIVERIADIETGSEMLDTPTPIGVEGDLGTLYDKLDALKKEYNRGGDKYAKRSELKKEITDTESKIKELRGNKKRQYSGTLSELTALERDLEKKKAELSKADEDRTKELEKEIEGINKLIESKREEFRLDTERVNKNIKTIEDRITEINKAREIIYDDADLKKAVVNNETDVLFAASAKKTVDELGTEKGMQKYIEIAKKQEKLTKELIKEEKKIQVDAKKQEEKNKDNGKMLEESAKVTNSEAAKVEVKEETKIVETVKEENKEEVTQPATEKKEEVKQEATYSAPGAEKLSNDYQITQATKDRMKGKEHRFNSPYYKIVDYTLRRLKELGLDDKKLEEYADALIGIKHDMYGKTSEEEMTRTMNMFGGFNLKEDNEYVKLLNNKDTTLTDLRSAIDKNAPEVISNIDEYFNIINYMPQRKLINDLTNLADNLEEALDGPTPVEVQIKRFENTVNEIVRILNAGRKREMKLPEKPFDRLIYVVEHMNRVLGRASEKDRLREAADFDMPAANVVMTRLFPAIKGFFKAQAEFLSDTDKKLSAMQVQLIIDTYWDNGLVSSTASKIADKIVTRPTIDDFRERANEDPDRYLNDKAVNMAIGSDEGYSLDDPNFKGANRYGKSMEGAKFMEFAKANNMEVILEPDDSSDTPIYVRDSKGKFVKTTWGEFKNRPENTSNQETIKIEYQPIKIIMGGKHISYIHATSFVNADRIKKDNIVGALEELRKLRKKVINGSANGTVKGRINLDSGVWGVRVGHTNQDNKVDTIANRLPGLLLESNIGDVLGVIGGSTVKNASDPKLGSFTNVSLFADPRYDFDGALVVLLPNAGGKGLAVASTNELKDIKIGEHSAVDTVGAAILRIIESNDIASKELLKDFIIDRKFVVSEVAEAMASNMDSTKPELQISKDGVVRILYDGNVYDSRKKNKYKTPEAFVEAIKEALGSFELNVRAERLKKNTAVRVFNEQGEIVDSPITFHKLYADNVLTDVQEKHVNSLTKEGTTEFSYYNNPQFTVRIVDSNSKTKPVEEGIMKTKASTGSQKAASILKLEEGEIKASTTNTVNPVVEDDSVADPDIKNKCGETGDTKVDITFKNAFE